MELEQASKNKQELENQSTSLAGNLKNI